MYFQRPQQWLGKLFPEKDSSKKASSAQVCYQITKAAQQEGITPYTSWSAPSAPSTLICILGGISLMPQHSRKTHTLTRGRWRNFLGDVRSRIGVSNTVTWWLRNQVFPLLTKILVIQLLLDMIETCSTWRFCVSKWIRSFASAWQC